jgi:F-type H+-transporting ATPase subunit delta
MYKVLKNHYTFVTLFLQTVRVNLQEALKVASGNGTEAEKTEARIEADVYEALQAALSK